MLIGINAEAAFKKPKTGVEEYTSQLVNRLSLLAESRGHQVVLYSRHNLKWPLPMWTQIRLSAEMKMRKPDVLFIPVHVLPLIHPQNSVVTIHGLEYEYYPKMYPWRHLKYIRWSTKYALKNARKIIAVSENTKSDLLKFYNGDAKKIEVVYHGYSLKDNIKKPTITQKNPFILFIGRLEAKKNIQGLIKAFSFLKNKYKIPHQLILAGHRGYGYRPINCKDVIEKGYISDQKKWQLLQEADAFAFPSFYEGFGLPILEAQSAGCPVIASNVSSLPEVAGEGAILVDPKNIEQIAQALYKIISDQQLKENLVRKGKMNIQRFSWQKCAQETLQVLEK